MEPNVEESVRRYESRFETADGSSLFRRGWLPQQPRGALLLVHGFAEHSGRYEAFGAWFAARGWAVHAFDHRGHGRSPGRRNFVRRFDDFLDDLCVFEALAKGESVGLPMVIVGHSMGGLISAAYARERQPDGVAGLALSGPALLPPTAFPGSQRVMMRVLSKLLPRMTVQSVVVPEALSRDPEVGRRYIEDPLVDTGMTAGLAAEMMAAAGRTVGRASDITMPLLLQHGGEDPLCPPSCSQNFHASRAPDGPETEIRIYPELRHEIFNEPERERVFADLAAWIEGVCEPHKNTPGD
jgi:alpha-beta hydrolase superfamily lysophospholipase